MDKNIHYVSRINRLVYVSKLEFYFKFKLYLLYFKFELFKINKVEHTLCNWIRVYFIYFEIIFLIKLHKKHYN